MFCVRVNLCHIKERTRLRVFENRVLKKTLRSKGDAVMESGGNYIANELLCFYSSTDVILLIKSRTMRRAGNLACMGQRRGTNRVLMEKHQTKISL